MAKKKKKKIDLPNCLQGRKIINFVQFQEMEPKTMSFNI